MCLKFCGYVYLLQFQPKNYFVCFRLGANPEIKNEAGLTAYDLAVRSDYNSILALFNEPTDAIKTKPRPRSAKKKTSKIRHTSSEESDSDSTIEFL